MDKLCDDYIKVKNVMRHDATLIWKFKSTQSIFAEYQKQTLF